MIYCVNMTNMRALNDQYMGTDKEMIDLCVATDDKIIIID